MRLRDRLEGRRAFHHYNYGSVQRGDDKGVAAFAEATHPVFRTHEETGKKAVYVNRLMTRRIVDLPEGESDAAARRKCSTIPRIRNGSTSTSGGRTT